MTDLQLILMIIKRIKKDRFNVDLYRDCLSIVKNYKDINIKMALKYSKILRELCNEAILEGINVIELSEIANKTLLFEAPYLFDSYMLYLEKDRVPSERFYIPRRIKLRSIVEAIQDLEDDLLDEVILSMPPRVGKTTILLFAVTWLLGRNSERSNLYSAYSDIITKKFYDGILEIIGDSFTYKWNEIFPNAKIVSQNSKDETLNIDRNKRYPSITCRSLYGTLNGACDCNGFLIADDLIGGIEEALNPDRMVAAWSKVDNNLIPRAKENAKILWCGTRWSNLDPAGLRINLLETDITYEGRRVRVINIPALDENDESNFLYDFGVGFSTEFYRQRRASFEKNNDMASWYAQYQGEPIERKGALFIPEDMKYFNGILPNEEPDKVFMSCDVAFGGGDFLSAPVAYQYGEDIYIPAVIFDNGDKTITEPRVTKLIIDWKVKTARFEKNNGGDFYKTDIENELKKKDYKLNITSKSAPNTKRKEARIYENAPEIRNFYFLESNKRDKDYSMFMQNLFSFKITGGNKHDDAPDSLSQLAEMVTKVGKKTYEIFKRPF